MVSGFPLPNPLSVRLRTHNRVMAEVASMLASRVCSSAGRGGKGRGDSSIGTLNQEPKREPKTNTPHLKNGGFAGDLGGVHVRFEHRMLGQSSARPITPEERKLRP